MNPLNFEEVIAYLGKVNKAVYGVNPYEVVEIPENEDLEMSDEEIKRKEDEKKYA